MPDIERDAPNSLRDPDAFYAALVTVHDRLTADQCRLLDARLILLLAQCIGDDALVHEQLREAARGIDTPPGDPPR